MMDNTTIATTNARSFTDAVVVSTGGPPVAVASESRQ